MASTVHGLWTRYLTPGPGNRTHCALMTVDDFGNLVAPPIEQMFFSAGV